MTHQPRIVSLCPSNTEILHALNLLDHVVAIDNYSDWPASQLTDKIRLGPDLHIDVEQLMALKPDFVLASLSVPGMDKVVEQLEATRIPQLTLSPKTFTDMQNDIRAVGAYVRENLHLSVDETAVCESLFQRIERVRALTAQVTQRPSLYFEWWPKPVFSPAKDNWLTEMSQLAGGINIFGQHDGSQVKTDDSDVVSKNPDFYLGVWTGVPQKNVPIQKIRARFEHEQSDVSFLHKHRFYILNEGLYCRPSPRLVDGLEQLVALIHPDIAHRLTLPHPTTYAPVRKLDGAWLTLDES